MRVFGDKPHFFQPPEVEKNDLPKEGEGLVCIAEVRVAVVRCVTCSCTAIDMLISNLACLVFRLALLKSAALINAASGHMVSSLHKVQ